LSTQAKKDFPTWIVVVVIILLAGPIIWALTIFMSVLQAMSIGGILVVIGIVALFVWLNKRVNG
jgi:hypothetical protein